MNDAESPPTDAPAVSAEEARKAGAALKVELEEEDGRLVYSVGFANNTDVEVDAMTGEVFGAEPVED